MLEHFDNIESSRIIYIRIKANDLVINLIKKNIVPKKKIIFRKDKGGKDNREYKGEEI